MALFINYIFGYMFILFKTIQSDMKTAKKIVTILSKGNIFPLKVSSLREDGWYLTITNLCQNTHFKVQIHQYTCFNLTIPQTIQFSICKILDIVCDRPCWICFGQVISPVCDISIYIRVYIYRNWHSILAQ